MRVVVTGASSFLGAHLVRHLTAVGHDVVGIVNRTPLAGARTVALDLTQPGAGTTLAGLDPGRIVHLAMKVGDPIANDAMLAAVIEATRLAGAGLIHASTTQVHWAKPSAYGLGRRAEEATIAGSGVSHVILRPCAPYGPRLPDHQPRHVESFHRLADAVRRGVVVPVIGDGQALRQPVHTRDWSDVIARFVDRPLPDAAFDVGGPRPMTVDAIIDKLALACGTRPFVVHVPVAAAAFAARWVDGLPPDVVRAFPNDDTADPAAVAAATGKTDWVRFDDGAAELFGGWRAL